jgi:hypothetical protein
MDPLPLALSTIPFLMATAWSLRTFRMLFCSVQLYMEFPTLI